MLDAKVDGNQSEIVKALVKAGAEVLSLARLGRGAPDLLVYYNGLHLMEIKSAHGQLRASQIRFRKDWPVHVVRTAEEALRVIGRVD